MDILLLFFISDNVFGSRGFGWGGRSVFCRRLFYSEVEVG